MIKNVIAGFWICTVTLASCYAAFTWTTGQAAPSEKEAFVGLQYKKLPTMNVPVIVEGAVQGYVVANLVFTADSETLRRIAVPAEAFVQDEIFRHIYGDQSLDFRKLSRYDVNAMLLAVKEKANKRLGADIIKEILVENFNFVDKSDIRS